MKKFIIKNRPKRKYIRKNASVPTFSLSKTIYGVLPLIVVIVAFMATLVISLPFRDSLTKIRFTLQLPQFSLTNPFSFFGTLFNYGIQIIEDFGSFCSVLLINCVHTLETIGSGTINVFTFLNPLPLFVAIGNATIFIGNIVENVFSFIFKCVTIGYNDLFQGLTVIFSIIGSFTSSLFLSIYSALLYIAQFIVGVYFGTIHMTGDIINSFFQTILHAIVTTGMVISSVTIHGLQAIIYAFSIFLKIMMTVLKVIVSIIVFIGTAVFTFISQVIVAVVHIIEIPFKILYAFWLVIKPYVDIFLHHVQLTGSDFSKGLTDLANLPKTVSSSK